jgi:flagellar motility protein MotE (MotC chaperone)
MSAMIKFLSVAIVLFSVAAGVSWYMQNQQQDPAGADHAEKEAKAPGEHVRVKPAVADATPPRPLLRPSGSPEAERLTRMLDSLQVQQESLKNREKSLADREKQMDLVHDEIKKDQKKLDAVRKEIETELQLVQEKLETLERRASESRENIQRANATLEEAKSVSLELNGVESKNLKQMANIYDKMDPEAAAQNIQQMTDKGKLDTAVAILANMRDRQAASVLGEISKQNSDIAVQLFDRMRYFKANASEKK